MKITASQLRRIIREEASRLAEGASEEYAEKAWAAVQGSLENSGLDVGKLEQIHASFVQNLQSYWGEQLPTEVTNHAQRLDFLVRAMASLL